MGRALDKRFLNDLESGELAPLAEAVRSDSTLCLELRGAYINVYYRGGNLMKVESTGNGYSAIFDKDYFKGEKQPEIPKALDNRESLGKWLDAWPCLKRAIDRYLAEEKGKYEREFQQLFVRDNNFGRVERTADGTIEYKKKGIARSTDYYICDIEYARSGKGKPWQFDMIAVHWPSQEHKKTDNRRLVFVEAKHGDNALKNSAGLHKHIRDVNGFLDNLDEVNDLKKDMVQVFKQKRKLGLMDCDKDLGSFSDEKPILLLALANHNPDSSILHGVLKELPECPNAELRLGTASFFGYGLYDQGVHTVDEARRRFGDYIYRD